MIGVRLAAADLAREPLVFACQVAAICAVIAPLLVLLGLKSGIVDGLLAELRRDPRSLRISVRGDRTLMAADIDRIRALPGVGFLEPASRSIAARAYIEAVPGGRVERVGLEPSGAGDPLLPPGTVLGTTQAALPAVLAGRLGVGVGGRVIARNARGADRSERLDLPLEVVAVLPDRYLADGTALVTPAVIETVEAFLDGFAVPQSEAGGRPLAERQAIYENVRLYADRLEAVAPLAAALETMLATPTMSARAEIAQITSLDRDLTLVFALIATVGGTGLLLATGAQVWANVERKRRHLSVLRLLGAPGHALLAFPFAQALAVVLTAALLAYAVYAGIAAVINVRFAGSLPEGVPVCAARPAQLAAAGLLTLGGACLAALVGGLKARRIAPVEGMRET